MGDLGKKFCKIITSKQAIITIILLCFIGPRLFGILGNKQACTTLQDTDPKKPCYSAPMKSNTEPKSESNHGDPRRAQMELKYNKLGQAYAKVLAKPMYLDLKPEIKEMEHVSQLEAKVVIYRDTANETAIPENTTSINKFLKYLVNGTGNFTF